MKRMMHVLVLFFSLTCMAGCAYVNIQTPYDTDLDETTLGQKVGRASCYSVLWLVAWGDAGTAAAAREGKISVIRHMDQQSVAVLLGLYASQTTIVYGD
jgi:hypothetical protein